MQIDNYNFTGKRALIRVDYNVPIDKDTNEITDDTRIRLSIPTLKKVLKDGGSIVLMSHMGRPKDCPEEKYSLKQIVSTIEKHLGCPIKFADDCISDEAFELSANLKSGEVLLLENLRFYQDEKKGDSSFAEKLSMHGDVYINDAFGTAHRAHASTTVIASFFTENKLFGYLIENEIKSVEKVLKSELKPLTAIVGGAKVSSKIIIISKLLDKVDHLIIGGGMAYTFIKAKGGDIGNSLVENDHMEDALKIIKLAEEKGVELHLPIDTVIADEFSNEAQIKTVKINNIPDGWMGLDIAEESISVFNKVIGKSKLILWNGPMGVFEMEAFQEGTKSVATAIANATNSGAFSLVGGGDSVAAINKYELSDQISHVSTGGGAMLEYLEGKVLPGLDAIINN